MDTTLAAYAKLQTALLSLMPKEHEHRAMEVILSLEDHVKDLSRQQLAMKALQNLKAAATEQDDVLERSSSASEG